MWDWDIDGMGLYVTFAADARIGSLGRERVGVGSGATGLEQI